MKTSSIFKNSISSAIYTGLSLLFPLISAMYVSRILYADGIGKVAYAQSIVTYFTMLAQMGIVSLGIREIAKVRDNTAQRNVVFSELFSLNTITTTLSLALYFLLLVIKNGFGDWPLFLATGLLIFFNFFNIDWFFQGEEKYTYIVTRSSIVKILALCSLFVFVHHKSDYIIYALITSLALGVNNLFNIFYSRKFVHFTFHNISLKHFVKPFIILAITTICSTLYSQIDTTMLGSLSTDSAVGWYNYTHKIAFICISVSAAISRVFYPRLSYYYQHNKQQFIHLIQTGVDVLSFLTFPICMGLLLLAPALVVFFFGDSFAPAASTLQIFIPFVFIRSFGNLLCYQLMLSTGNERKQLPIIIGGTFINIILNFLLIPLFAQNGAAVASIVTELFINLTQFVYIKRYLSLRLSCKSIWFGIGNSVLMGFVLYWFLPYLQPTIFSLGGIIGVGFVIYILLNIVEKNTILCLLYTKLSAVLPKKGKTSF